MWHDLRESPWAVSLRGLTFHFSTHARSLRFMEMARTDMEKLSREMTRRCGVRVDMEIPALMRLYQRIETNGFLIDCEKGCATCPAEVELDGFKVRLTA